MSSLRIQERSQCSQGLIRYFFRQEMPSRQRLAAHIGGAFPPDSQGVKQPVHRSAPAPESKHWTKDFALKIFFVVFHIDGRACAVVLTITGWELKVFCGLIPAVSMIRAALSLSLNTKLANSGCDMFIGSAPCFASHSRKSDAASARAMSLASLSTTPAGVPAGVHTPYQIG